MEKDLRCVKYLTFSSKVVTRPCRIEKVFFAGCWIGQANQRGRKELAALAPSRLDRCTAGDNLRTMPARVLDECFDALGFTGKAQGADVDACIASRVQRWSLPHRAGDGCKLLHKGVNERGVDEEALGTNAVLAAGAPTGSSAAGGPVGPAASGPAASAGDPAAAGPTAAGPAGGDS